MSRRAPLLVAGASVDVLEEPPAVVVTPTVGVG
jgi:hypothetical protein